MIRTFVLAAALLAPAAALADPPLLPIPASGVMAWHGWTFEYHVGDANQEGLVVTDVKWKGTKVLAKGSMPVIRVKYRGDGSGIEAGCGPYRDRIDWSKMELLQGAFTFVTARIFTFAKHEELELAILGHIGGYRLFQAWYFSSAGRLEPMLYSLGWSCDEKEHENDHKHHPYWRLDFDVEGTNNEVWVIRTKKNAQVQSSKFAVEADDRKLDDDNEVAWSINKPGSSKHVLIRSPLNEPGDASGKPWFQFSSKDAAIRRFNQFEDLGWTFASPFDLGFSTPAESVAGKDIVFWSIGHLTHIWDPADVGDPKWHSRGAVVEVNW